MQRPARSVCLLFSLAIATIPAMPQDAMDLVRQWFATNAAGLGLEGDAATAWEVTDRHVDRQGRTFVYVRQTAHGLSVDGAVANFVVTDGRVILSGNRLQGQLAARLAPAVPGISAEEALRAAARHLGLQAGEIRAGKVVSPTEVIMGPCGISRDSIPVRLAYRVVPGQRGIPLAWHVVIRETNGRHWWHIAVDAHGGTVMWKHDWVTHCTFPDAPFARTYNALDDLVPDGSGDDALGGGAGPGYRVFAFPTESPLYGPHVWLDDPSDGDASPFGWHDTDGMAGPEHTITRGNNVYAGEDFDDDDEIGYSPDGGPSLTFDFPYDQAEGPLSYLDAAVTNLFYTCNVLHDVWHHYGFDEAAGNFQYTNYTGFGEGNDEVYAQAQDGGGMNNANFATPPDGWSGAMQMYLWRTSEGDSLIINSPSSVAGGYAVVAAGFGPVLPTPPITADLALMEDGTAPLNDGCDPLVNAAQLEGKIAVVDRGLCTFVSKAEAAEAAGAVGLVVINNVGGTSITMGGDDTGIGIPAVMISMANGQALKNAMQQGTVNATLGGPAPGSIRDGDLDNGVIAHEYGHGVSNRLTGGPADSDCLWNDEQMGEGWSDWMAMVLTMKPGDQAETPRGMANFVLGEEIDGQGLRPAPYTTDMAVNPYTYGNSNSFAFQGAHALGFLWATMLWDLTWALVDEEGFDPDVYQGTGGNNIAMRLVLDGMKLQPCGPGFVDGRDAILLADQLNYGGAHACLIWEAFARRGLGYGASQGSPDSVSDQVQDFSLPSSCLTGVPDASGDALRPFVLLPNPAADAVTLLLHAPAGGGATVRVLTADGRTVREASFQGGRELHLDLSGMAPGMYVVQLDEQGRRTHARLVVR